MDLDCRFWSSLLASKPIALLSRCERLQPARLIVSRKRRPMYDGAARRRL